MKLKGKVFAYVAMITLSLSVMLYGVYSAMTASLSISGSLGFIPHGSKGTAQIVSVTGALNNDGTEYTLADADKSNIINWQDSTTLTLTNPIYLDDISNFNSETGEYKNGERIAPIKITLKLVNTSTFAVKILAKSNVQLQTNETTPTDIAGLTYSYSAISLAKAGESEATNDKFTITITPNSNLITEGMALTSFAISVDIDR